MLQLTDLFKTNGSIYFSKPLKKRQFKNVSLDSRTVTSGELFFAIKGEKHDAHQYLKQVFERGCQLAVVNKDWFFENGKNFYSNNFFVVEDTTLALGQFAREHKRRINPKTLVIGGSNGKTTTKEMIASVLLKKYKVLYTAGNFNNHIGVPLTLLRLTEKHQWCVLEIGCNHFNEINYLCQIAEPDYGLITNIGKEHLEFFKNKAGVAKAEFEMLDYFENSPKPKIFFANLEDHYIAQKVTTLKKTKVISYSYNKESTFKAKFCGYTKQFNPILSLINKPYQKYLFEINAFGKHSIYNGLAAITTGLYFKVEPQKIIAALKHFKSGSNKRMEVINKNGITIINDTYNSNPDSVLLGLSTLAELPPNITKHIVLGDMLELGQSSIKEHTSIGKAIEKYKFPYLYTFGPHSSYTSQAVKKITFNKHFNDKLELIKNLKINLKKGDLVYVKGSRGMKMEEVVEALIN